MNLKKNKGSKKRPYRMSNVSFPPAKYGAITAVIIIIVCSLMLFLD